MNETLERDLAELLQDNKRVVSYIAFPDGWAILWADGCPARYTVTERVRRPGTDRYSTHVGGALTSAQGVREYREVIERELE